MFQLTDPTQWTIFFATMMALNFVLATTFAYCLFKYYATKGDCNCEIHGETFDLEEIMISQ